MKNLRPTAPSQNECTFGGKHNAANSPSRGCGAIRRREAGLPESKFSLTDGFVLKFRSMTEQLSGLLDELNKALAA